jgi:TonB family protein
MFAGLHQDNLKYPDDAKKKGIEGKVLVSFVIEKDGTLTVIKVIKSVSPDLDAEAIRVIARSPKWVPGIQNGRPVRVKYSVGVIFALPTLHSTAEQNQAEQRQLDSLRKVPFDQRIFSAVEYEPEFKGGGKAFSEYLQTSISLPC